MQTFVHFNRICKIITLCNAKRNYFTNAIEVHKNNMKQMWNNVNDLINIDKIDNIDVHCQELDIRRCNW